MKYSKFFGKTVREAPSDATFISHKLLHQAGYIRESTAGRYFFLPLGMRIQQNIMKIIKQEMNKAGGQELVAPIFHPLDLWKETNRNNEAGFELTLLKDRRGAEFVPGGTAEEMMVDLVRKFQLSYKDLPFNIYQFSSKFRDEMRARGGLLRVREFIMKDAYSFDSNEEEFKKEYKKMWDTYARIFERLSLKAIVVEADNGYIGGDYCHEFVVESDAGESKFLVTEDGTYAAHEDVAAFTREPINHDQEIKPLQIIEQPTWVKTMEDNEKHYKLHASRFLKNVVYKMKRKNEIIIAVIRGDLDINKTKLEQVLDYVGQLEEATTEDLAAIGTKSGFVHSWGHKDIRDIDEKSQYTVRYIGDVSLESVRNVIGGQKTETTDTINVNYGRDFKCELIADIALAKDGYLSIDGKKLIEKKGIEVGNIFQLGLHYSTKMSGATFIDVDGKPKPYYMGCYGIGVGRTMATLVEMHHDDKGIIWPEAVAPFAVHLIGLDLKQEDIRKNVETLYEKLLQEGIEVLYDDREEVSAGIKFNNADLIGIPHRLVISKRTGDKIEYKKRAENESKLLSLEELLEVIKV